MQDKDAPSYTNVLATKLRAELDQTLAREAVLQVVVSNLCEQHERQEDMEECGRRGSYPRKLPDWEQAWEQAFAVRYGASQVATALLEQLEDVVAREAVLIQELSFWSNADELEEDLVNAIGDGWKCWLSGEQRDRADRAQEICSAYVGGEK